MIGALLAVGCDLRLEEAPRQTQALQISFEPLPGRGLEAGGQIHDASMALYRDEAALGEDVLAQVVPDVIAAVQLDREALAYQLAPHGLDLATSPSLQIRGLLSEEGGSELAAAIGYTTYQWAVLVTDFREREGDIGFGIVRFTDGAPTPDLAQSFFEHAARVDAGLGGRYTAFGDDMIFLNLRDEEGSPASGLDDEAFVDALVTAASTFEGARAELAESGRVRAWLISNDWTGWAPAGEEYAEIVGDAAVPALDAERADYLELLDEASEQHGWGAPPM